MHKKFFIVIFMAILWIPFLTMFFVKTDMSAEKREVAKMPDITIKGQLNTEYPQQLTDYFNDNFGFRQNLITLDAKIKGGLFSTSNNKKVIIGNDGWLYFNETLDDYFSRNVMTKRGVFDCAKTLALINESVENEDRQFLFVVAPNKNSIYPENMPFIYVKGEEINNYSLLQEAMAKLNVNTIDLKEAFLSEDKVLYHKKDTHWTNEGAAFAMNLILDNLGKKHTNFVGQDNVVKNDFNADLQDMLYPTLNLFDDQIYYKMQHTQKYLGRFKSTEDLSILSSDDKEEKTVVMYRDSFGNALVPFVADQYAKGFFTRAIPYDLEMPSFQGADDVIIELVERNIPTLKSQTPLMDALYREVSGDITYVEDSNTRIFTKKEDGKITYYGQVDSNYISDEGSIYIKVYNDVAEGYFEAFPTATTSEEGKQITEGDYCFSARLSMDSLEEGVYNVDVITQKNDQLYGVNQNIKLEIQ